MQHTIELDVEGERFEALVRGPEDGPVALFLHGFPDLPRCWLGVMDRMAAEGWRCVAPWLRGYPPSTVRGPYHLDRITADLLGFADALSPDRPLVALGHDWGAAALWFAARQAPERFTRVVTAAVPFPVLFVRRALVRPTQIWRSRYMFAFQVRNTDRAEIERLWRRWSPGFEPPEDHLDAVAAAVRDSAHAPVKYYRAAFRTPALGRHSFDRRTVDVPVLYLHGRDDGCVANGLQRGQERWIDAPYREVVVDDAGHFAPMEQPDAVADAVLDFLSADLG